MMSCRSLAVLVWCLAVTSFPETSGLDFHMNITQGNACGHLTCSLTTNQTDERILSFIDIAIFDVTRAKNTLKLASVSLTEPDVYVDDAQKILMSACGTVSQYQASLDISFSKASHCERGTYSCVLNFLDRAGRADVVQAAVNANEATDAAFDPVPPLISFQEADTSKQIIHAVNNLAEATNHLALTMSSLMDIVTRLDETTNKLINSTGQGTNHTDEFQETVSKYDDRFAAIDTALENITRFLEKALVGKREQGECYNGMANTTMPAFINVTVLGSRPALCDTQTDGGGWIVIQNRMDGEVDFYRGWEEYKNGFGKVTGDYWLGNEAIHRLTVGGNYELRIDLTYEGQTYYAQYSRFVVGCEQSEYKLSIDDYAGDAGDSMIATHNNRPFSTFDRNNVKSCASTWHSAWWFNNCYKSNLNGVWGENSYKGMCWLTIKDKASMSSSQMKIRRI